MRLPSSARVRFALQPILLAALAFGVVAPAVAEDGELTTAQIAEAVRELEAAVAAQRARLIELVGMARAPGAMALHDEPELQALARELPELEAELERWAQIETGQPEPAAPPPATP